MEPINTVQAEQAKEPYQPPVILVYGSLLDLARGSSGNESDGCSSGYYQTDEGDE